MSHQIFKSNEDIQIMKFIRFWRNNVSFFTFCMYFCATKYAKILEVFFYHEKKEAVNFSVQNFFLLKKASFKILIY